MAMASYDPTCLLQGLLHVGSDVLHGQHGLLTGGLDLGLGEQETIATSVTQLEDVGVFHTQVIGPVNRASRSRV